MSDDQVRRSYNKAVTEAFLYEFAPRFKAIHQQALCFGEELARVAFEIRNMIKLEHQNQTSKAGQIAIEMHNLQTYQQSQNPSYEYFQAHYNPEEIAYSAFRTGGEDLGLENNGFGATLKCWKEIQDFYPEIYPEDLLIETNYAFYCE